MQLISETGQSQGNLKLEEALSNINKKTHDLILVSEFNNIPVCKVVSKKVQFDAQKKTVKKAPQLKELEINSNIADGDFKTKMNMATTFLSKGNNIQFTLKKNGEVKVDALMELIKETLKDLGTVQGQPKPAGRLLIFTVKANKPK